MGDAGCTGERTPKLLEMVDTVAQTVARGATLLTAEPGEMVLVEITRWPTATRGPVGKVSEVLGNLNEPGVDTQIIIRKFGIPDEHGPEAVHGLRRTVRARAATTAQQQHSERTRDKGTHPDLRGRMIRRSSTFVLP